MSRSGAPGHAPPGNQLLAALPQREYDHLRSLLEAVPLAPRAVLYESRQPISHVYFPTTGVVSMLSPPEGKGEGTEVGIVGREGMTALSLFLGVATTPVRCVVQVPGTALRLRAADFLAHLGREGVLHRLLLRYTYAFLNQVSQTVACNARHPVGKRLARWVLLVQARVEADCFPLTHEFLAAMLGVRRASVSEAARTLQQAGLIRYERGLLTVLDRRGLEAAACACYHLIQAEFNRPPD